MGNIAIHPTAVVHPNAKIAAGVAIGPYTVVEEHVILEKDSVIGSHCVITGRTTIGRNARVFTGAVIGSIPQDKKFNPKDPVTLEIGADNVIREYVTINPGTLEGGGRTVIGDGNLLMAYCHVAHDCRIGHKCIMANAATLGGHVELENNVTIGGFSAVHQYTRLGRLCIVGGCSKVVQDVPPFSMCDGHPARVHGLNSVGLKRAGFSSEALLELKRAFKTLFHSGLSRGHALAQLAKSQPLITEVRQLVDFIQASKRGVCGGERVLRLKAEGASFEG
ncbi:MAG: acyl-ACP--UDP-N-acetylglucosamine O-acyltransferase [Candidatus Omnitrophica bacterium]|nr:acyl-ACP--UDP-N-acetylglucosamine O-acyltransferase [Candidatus Omnitrophota bacterium]